MRAALAHDVRHVVEEAWHQRSQELQLLDVAGFVIFRILIGGVGSVDCVGCVLYVDCIVGGSVSFFGGGSSVGFVSSVGIVSIVSSVGLLTTLMDGKVA